MPRREDAIRVVCISDTHGLYNFPVPDGDILIHAGDFSKVCSAACVPTQAKGGAL